MRLGTAFSREFPYGRRVENAVAGYIPQMLSLLQALNFVTERLGGNREQAMLQLRDTLRDGAIEATGYVDFYGEPTLTTLEPGWWLDGEIDWEASTVRSEIAGARWWTNVAEGVQVSRSCLDAVFPVVAIPGIPGRPTGMPVVLNEFERRAAARVLEATVTDQAKQLERWFGKTHARDRKLSAKAIENNIRVRYRELKKAAQDPKP